MGILLESVHRLTRYFLIVGEIALTFMMFLTVSDVILRSFRRPIVGTYEIVAFSAAVAIGFSLPLTSWMRGHVYVDLFTEKTLGEKKECVEHSNPMHRSGSFLF